MEDYEARQKKVKDQKLDMQLSDLIKQQKKSDIIVYKF